MNTGIPQGTISGPLLFLIYTAELHSLLEEYGASCRLFADDTQIYFSLETAEGAETKLV